MQCGDSNTESGDEETLAGTRHGWSIPYAGWLKDPLAREQNEALGGSGMAGRGVTCCSSSTFVFHCSS